MKRIIIHTFFILLSLIIINCSDREEIELVNGKVSFNSGDYKDAIKHFRKVYNKNPKNKEANLYLGRSFLNLNNDNSYIKSIAYLKTAIKYKPNYAEAYVYLGEAYQKKFFEENRYKYSYVQNSYPVSNKTVACYQKAINLKPNYALPYYRMGHLYGFLRNEVSEALNWYNKGIAINDNYTNIYLNIGQLYLKRNDIDKAIENFKKEILRNPNSLLSYSELSQCYIRKTKYINAIKYLKILADKDPNYEGLDYKLGVAYQNIDKLKSIEFMKIAARLGDRNAWMWLKQKKINW